ncbi:hypothetical protein, partial [Bilophila wadsworthia]|uniref:hypothetical protein n=1 Tax=Bilophila wadsworthia TaxID=35833 RepID=UPI003AB51027
QKTKIGEFHQNTSYRYDCTERKGEKAIAPGSQRELLYKSNTVSAKDKNPARPQGRLSLSTSRAGSFPASTNRDSG